MLVGLTPTSPNPTLFDFSGFSAKLFIFFNEKGIPYLICSYLKINNPIVFLTLSRKVFACLPHSVLTYMYCNKTEKLKSGETCSTWMDVRHECT